MAERLFSSDMGGRVPGTLYLKDSDDVTTEYNPESGHPETTFSVGPKCIVLRYNTPDTDNLITRYKHKLPIICEYDDSNRVIHLNMIASANDIAIFTAVMPGGNIHGPQLYSARYDITDGTWTLIVTDL